MAAHRFTNLLFFKPYGVLCQFTDVANRPTLKDFIPLPGIYPAGRLDLNSEGLLFLSNDGVLIQRLTDPRFEHPKTYLAQVEGVLTTAALVRLKQAIVLPGLQTCLPDVEIISEPKLPPRPVPVRAYHPATWLKITLWEGKKHQVRRMTAAVGFPTLRLVRVAIGSLTIGNLQPGKWRRLSESEELALKRSQSPRK